MTLFAGEHHAAIHTNVATRTGAGGTTLVLTNLLSMSTIVMMCLLQQWWADNSPDITNPLWAKNARFCSEHINDWKIVQKNEDLNHLWTFLNWNCEMPNFVQNKSPWHRITSMIWLSVKKKSFLWRNGSKVKIWGTYHLPLNKCECFDELKLWKSQHCPLDDCPYDRLVICEIKKTYICKMSEKTLQPISKLVHCLSTNLQP